MKISAYLVDVHQLGICFDKQLDFNAIFLLNAKASQLGTYFLEASFHLLYEWIRIYVFWISVIVLKSNMFSRF